MLVTSSSSNITVRLRATLFGFLLTATASRSLSNRGRKSTSHIQKPVRNLHDVSLHFSTSQASHNNVSDLCTGESGIYSWMYIITPDVRVSSRPHPPLSPSQSPPPTHSLPRNPTQR